MKNFLEQSWDRIKAQFGGWQDYVVNILDILLVAFLLYLLFLFLKKHNCSRLIKITVLTVIAAVIIGSDIIGFNMMGRIAAQGVMLLIIVLVLLFPQEIKRTLWKVSSPKDAAEMFTTGYGCSDEELKAAISEIVRAAQNMAKKDVGALIVIAPQEVPYDVLESGTKLDANLTSPLLESIFNNKAPLHDGAVFIRGNRIIAAGCFLPLTQSTDLDKELGTRHRAAIGITETNNVVAIIVSEETGIISIAMRGTLQRYYDSTMLHDTLEQVYGLRAVTSEKKMRKHKNARK